MEVKTGVIQDASFVEADLGKKRYMKGKKARRKGEKVEYTEKQKQHLDREYSYLEIFDTETATPIDPKSEIFSEISDVTHEHKSER